MAEIGTTRREALVGGALFTGGLAFGAARAADDPSQALRRLIAASVAAETARDPLEAARSGVDGGVFIDPLADTLRAARSTAVQEDKVRLAAIDRGRLGSVDQIAYDVFAYRLDEIRADLTSGDYDIRRLTPLDPSFGPQVAFPDIASGAGARFANPADYEAGLRRLDGFSAALGSMVAHLREGMARGYLQPRIVVANVLAELDVMLGLAPADTPFFKPLRTLPAGVVAAHRERLSKAYLTSIETRVLPAYAGLRRFLKETYLPAAREAPGLWAMKQGDLVYAGALRRHTTTDLTADQIHGLGLGEVARIRGEMEGARRAIGYPGDLKALFQHVRTDQSFYFQRPEDLLDRFKQIEAKIWLGMPRLFRRRPVAPFEVRALPAVGQARGTGYYALGRPDGSTPGVLYFNMAMLGTRPIPTLETLTLHEGIPGHHFQGSLAQENTDLPDILRFGGGGFTAYVEGWGLYSESLGSALGLFTDPWQWFGHLDFEMLRAVRLVVDTGLHAKQWTRDAAVAYMTENTSMAPHDIDVEIDRYIAIPGQATAYKIGELKFKALRERAAAALNTRFDIRDFHDQVLMTGAMPLAILEAKIERWIAAGGPSLA